MTMGSNTEAVLAMKMCRVLFDNSPDGLKKVLWRMSHGCKAVALQLATKYCANYSGFEELSSEEFEAVFDLACSVMNDSCEVEWLS